MKHRVSIFPSTIVQVLVLLIVSGAAAQLAGQATDGNLAGNVSDPSGAYVPNANVELRNLATNVIRSAVTDASGGYRFLNVPVGSYDLTVRADGFTPKTVEKIEVVLNRTTTANISLQIGALTQEVSVIEAPPALDTTSATIGSSFGARQMIYTPSTDLTLGVLNLSLLSAGVASSGGLGLGEGPSVGGQRPRQNNFTIEGVDNNRKDVTGRNVTVPNEAVAEFSMLQNQFSAEFGRSTGGQFNTVVRSGTNELHGSVYEYLRNRHLNAIDQANRRQGILENPRLDDNRLGGAVGGPIIRDKLFYFGNYEYNPFGQAVAPSSATLTPTTAGYQMLAQIPGVSKTNLDVLQQYAVPSPQATSTTLVQGVDIPIGILPISFPNYQNTYNWVLSTDYHWTERDQVRFRYIENRTSGIDPDVSPNLPAFSNPRRTIGRLFNLSEFHTFSPGLLNELRLQYNRFDDDIPAGNFSFPGLDVFPNITIEQDLNLQLGPYDTAPQSTVLNTYQAVDNVSWMRGRHAFKFGIDARKYIAPQRFIQRERGDYGYTNLERYLLDLSPDVIAERNLGGVPYSGNQVEFYWYASDEMKLRPNLTLTLGLRHEYKGVPAGDKLQSLNSISDVPGLIEFRAPTAQKKNFAPRIGLAYSPGKSGSTVFRAGFSIAYDVYFDNLGLNSKPPQLESTFDVDPASNIPDFLASGGIRPDQRPASLDQAAARSLTSAYIFDQHLPYSIQWNFGVEKVLRNDYKLEARYLGTRGLRLFTQSRFNVKANVTADRNLPTFLQMPTQGQLDALPLTLSELRAASIFLPQYEAAGFESNITGFPNQGASTYHGLALELNKRYANGLQYKAAYTWSHAIDNSTADLFSTLLAPRRPQDFQNLAAERSSSFLDRRHRFTFSGVWDAPWLKGGNNWMLRNVAGNWIFSGTYTVESPQFGTVQSGLDSNLNGDSAGDRVILNPDGQDGVGSGVTALKNTAGETVAYLADNPNARYIRAGLGAFATSGRETLPMRRIDNFDLCVSKKFNITEHKALEIRAAFFNAFNHPQYTPGSLNSVRYVESRDTRNNLIPGNALFNDPTQVFDSHSREIHFSARFTF